MAYRVDISPSALQDAEDAYFWIKTRSPARAGQWYEHLLETIFSLENYPQRCPLAPESADIGKQIRQLFYGQRGRVYRILFALAHDQTTGEDVVRVYRIWPGARRPIAADEVKQGESQDY